MPSHRPIPTRFRDPLENESPRLTFVRKMQRLPAPTDEQISRFRDTLHDGDPLADAVTASFAELPRGEGHRLLMRAIEGGIASVPEAPPALIELFAELDVRPAWVDDAQLELGARVANRVGSSGERVLSCVCLTGGYRSSAANKPIAFTGALESMAYRRLAETSQFVLDLYDSPTLQRGSVGFRSAVMVRMLHSMVRSKLDVDPRWRHDEWGLPVNQADMLSTNLLFSTVFVLGVRALGQIITRREADAIVHFWRYVGFLMGIRPELLPQDFAEACQLVVLSGSTQPPGDEDSRKLAAALLSVPVDPDRPPWMQRLDASWRAGFSRLILGGREADELGLPDEPLKWLVGLTVLRNLSAELARFVIPGAGERIARSRQARVRRNVARSLDGVAAAYQPYPQRAE